MWQGLPVLLVLDLLQAEACLDWLPALEGLSVVGGVKYVYVLSRVLAAALWKEYLQVRVADITDWIQLYTVMALALLCHYQGVCIQWNPVSYQSQSVIACLQTLIGMICCGGAAAPAPHVWWLTTDTLTLLPQHPWAYACMVPMTLAHCKMSQCLQCLQWHDVIGIMLCWLM